MSTKHKERKGEREREKEKEKERERRKDGRRKEGALPLSTHYQTLRINPIIQMVAQ